MTFLKADGTMYFSFSHQTLLEMVGHCLCNERVYVFNGRYEASSAKAAVIVPFDPRRLSKLVSSM